MSCREITRLLSEALEGELSSDDRECVRRHLELCPGCRLCQRQFGWIRSALRWMVHES